MLSLLKPISFFVCFVLLLCCAGSAQKSPPDILQLYRQADSSMSRKLQNMGTWKVKKTLHDNKNHEENIKDSHAVLRNKYQVLSTIPEKLGGAASCIDTSVRLIYRKDPLGFGNDYITKTRDGNVLIPGWEVNAGGVGTYPHLIKCTQYGDTLWSRLIKCGDFNGSNDVYKAFELTDNSILLVGDVFVQMPYNGRYDPMIIRVSATGNLMWEKTFKTRLWDADTTEGSIDIIDCKQDAQGALYLCGDVRHASLPRSTLAFKMDLAGNVLWSRGYVTGSFPELTGVNITGQNVTFVGRTLSGNTVLPIGIVANPATGDTLRTTAFVSPTGDFWHNFYTNNMVKLQNGNLALYGNGVSDGSYLDATHLPTHSGVLEITADLQFVQSYIMRSATPANSYNTVTTVFDDGSAAYIRANFFTGWSGDVLFGSLKNGQLLKERVIAYRGLGIVWSSNFLQTEDGGQIITNFIGDSAANINDVEFMRLHNSDTSGSCLGNDTLATIVEMQYFYNTGLYVDSILTNVLTENVRPFDGMYNDNFVMSSNCKQVNFCDSLKLSRPKDTICANSTVKITFSKNRECGTNPLWTYDTTAISSFYKVNDTTMSATFNNPWQGNIMATINGCNTLQDSVHFTVLQAPALLNIGPDTVICPGNTILLNAKKGYATYKWQDGSIDSTFMVSQPGTYYVTTRDACGGIFSDTVTVVSHPPIPFDLGPDISICENDTATIAAPPGFLHYQWASYNIIADTDQVVKVFPAMSFMYKVFAEKTSGCFASDSIYVTVKKVPSVTLGNDTSFCINQSVVLDAGIGFDTYEWSSGESTEKILANQQGTFAVKATLNGCSSYDTMKVLNVYPLPSFSLGNDTTLCEGQQLQYNFNLPQAIYKWSTGNILNTQTINQPGTYWLQVMQTGCTNSDTIDVSYNPSPVISLGNDTTLCENEMLQLNAYNNNAGYLWQDGSNASGYLVKSAGTYFVTVNLNTCTESDTITITYKALPFFTLGKDSFLCTGQQYVLKPFINTNANLLWQNGSSAPSITVMKDGIYFLTATNECGSYTDSVIITAGFCDIIMPSGFTPNGDGINDVFKVKYPFPVKKFDMAIFDRFGEKVFETNDITNGWDGTWKGAAALQNTYVWIISFTDVNNKQQQLKGIVTLLR